MTPAEAAKAFQLRRSGQAPKDSGADAECLAQLRLLEPAAPHVPRHRRRVRALTRDEEKAVKAGTFSGPGDLVRVDVVTREQAEREALEAARHARRVAAKQREVDQLIAEGPRR